MFKIFLNHLFAGGLALILGIGFSWVLIPFASEEVAVDGESTSAALVHANGVRNVIRPGKFAPLSFRPPKLGKSIGVDLIKKEVTLFEDGDVKETLALLAIGAMGSAWETSAGNYAVAEKEALHRSPIARASMPWAVQFIGNSFFHGPLTYSAKEKPDSSGAALLGSLQLDSVDARTLYDFAELGIPVMVLDAKAKLATTNPTLTRVNSVGVEFRHLNAQPPRVSARSYLVYDLDTEETLLAKDADTPLPMASVSKLLTALVAEEQLKATDTLTVSGQAAQTFGAAHALSAGTQLKVAELYYPLLLESSNRAAEVLAEAEDRTRFIARLNSKVKELGMQSTYLADPSGLDPRNVSTANDLSRLATHLVQQRADLLKLTLEPDYVTTNGRHKWLNRNRLVTSRNKYYLGGKTGYIPEAGQTSVAIFAFPISEFVSKRVAVILLHSYNRDQDSRNILRYLQQGLFYDTGVPVNDDDLTRTRFSSKKATSSEALNLIAVGNILLDENLERALHAKQLNLAKLFQESYFVKSASLTLGHLIGPVATVGYTPIATGTKKTLAAVPQTLADVGFDSLLVANEHAGDWGRSGLSQTITALRRARIVPLGAGEDAAEARRASIHKVGNLKIGLLGVSSQAPRWLSESPNLAVLLSAADGELITVIKQASAEVDHLLITLSVPAESTPAAPHIQALARSFIDAGARGVLIMGPHVVGPIEHYAGGVIAYSLGDFIVRGEPGGASLPDGLALELIFDKKKVIAVNAEHVTLNDEWQPIIIDLAE